MEYDFLNFTRQSLKSTANCVELVCFQQVESSQKKGNSGVFPHFLFLNFCLFMFGLTASSARRSTETIQDGCYCPGESGVHVFNLGTQPEL